MWGSLDGFSGNGNNWKEEITDNAKKKRFDTNSCRQINQVLQLRANIWRGLVKMNEFSKKLCESDNEDKNAFHRTDREILRTSLKKQEEQLKDLIREEKKSSGPVGNIEVCGHIRFFLQQDSGSGWHKVLFNQDSNGNTALHMAVIHRQVAVVKWLLDAEEELSDSAKWEHRKSLLVMGISQFSFLDY